MTSIYSGVATFCYVLAAIVFFIGVITGLYPLAIVVMVLLAISRVCASKAKPDES